MRRLGWRKMVFLVDDNFAGDPRQALLLARNLAAWQERHRYPFAFYTEASIDLADRPELLAAMAEANFLYVFIGIETPSAEALQGCRKYQNLRGDNCGQILRIQQSGLWVMGGFIVGFDSDDESIFGLLLEFVERAAIAWAMTGVLQAVRTTPLYDRLKQEGRLIEDSPATSNFSPPNFRTRLPLPVLLRGLGNLLVELYEPGPFFKRAFRSLEAWHPRPTQRPPREPLSYDVRVWLASMWKQGVCSHYRREYWRFFLRIARSYIRRPAKMWMAFIVLLSAHHFMNYARALADELEEESRAL